jgi:CheY-like chemotaxis protein
MGDSHPPAQIVVINDDTPFLQLMHDLLTDEGYAVQLCREWSDAHQFVRQVQPDLVILDIVMGGEERGWNVLNLLTLDPATRPIAVLVCSAAVESLEDHRDLLAAYGIRALAKPFDLDALLGAVQQTLAERTSKSNT